jgi:hypothetical protein
LYIEESGDRVIRKPKSISSLLLLRAEIFPAATIFNRLPFGCCVLLTVGFACLCVLRDLCGEDSLAAAVVNDLFNGP